MTNVVLNVDGSQPVTLQISPETLTKVSWKPDDFEDIRQVRLLTAAVITVVETAVAGGQVPTVAKFIEAQLAAMNQAVAILNSLPA